MIWIKLFCSFKLYEVLCEAYPQAVLGIYMLLVLQQDELLNWISIVISLVSLVYGQADSVTYEKFDHNAPFSKIIYSGLSGVIDTFFRVIFISFFSSLSSPYSLFLFPLIYIFTFYLFISIKHKKIKLGKWEFYACFMTLPSSTYEHDKIDYTLRPISKMVFNMLAMICLSLTTGKIWEEYPRLKPKDFPENVTSASRYCENICDVTDISICRTFNQSEHLYQGILVSLWVLLALSTLEGIFERFFSFMPHRKFLEEIPLKPRQRNVRAEA